MKVSKIVTVSAKSILRHKLRTFLIVLAILVGIATLTVIVSLTQGTNRLIMKKIQNFGPDAIMVHSGGGKMRGPSTVDSANLTRKDVSDIENIEGVKFVSPFQIELDMPIKYGNKFTASWVMGVEPDWKDAWRRGASKGDFITYSDNEQLSKVCVIGQTVVKELFGKIDSIGKNILVTFKSCGIMQFGLKRFEY